MHCTQTTVPCILTIVMFDLISIGDCVIDIFVPLLDAGVEIKDKKRVLELNYGEKIPVGPASLVMGGNAANNAVGAARLGLKTAIYTNIGNDADGRVVLQNFKNQKVHTDYIVFNKQLPSNHNVVLEYQGERTILSHHQDWTYNLPDLGQTRWIYLTSLSPSFKDSNILNQIVNFLERSGAKLAFNPGTFHIKLGVKKNPSLLSLCELLIVNLEEAKLILDSEDAPVKKLLKEFSDLGIRKAVITDGKNGSYGYDGQNYFKLAIFPSIVKQMTGAGDGFATGTLAGLFHGKDLGEAMRWGAANGASVVEQVGPQTGLLTHGAMLEKLKENSKIVAKELK